jgi:hypothetical protein
LLVLSVYPEDQAGTRLRAHQYVPRLTADGVQVDLWSFLSLPDSLRWFSDAGPLERLLVLVRSFARLARLPGLLRRADVVLVLREVLPFATLAVERAAARRARLVWDVDDAVWTPYPRLFLRWVPERLRRSARKYEQLAGLADEVWAGSDVLAEWCRRTSSSVHVVPTVLDVAALPLSSGRSGGAAWVGSASTAEFLVPVLDALAGTDLEVECVGAAGLSHDGVRLRSRPWTQAAEDEVLSKARVGLYPVDVEHPLGPGKAGLKAVLYMAHGVPCVITPTETFASLVRHEVEGLHARSSEEWRHAVRRLVEDDDLWARLAAAGRRRAEEHFSLERWAPWVSGRVQALAGPV